MAGSVIISKDVEVEIYMEDIDTDDLLEELANRQLGRDCQLNKIIEALAYTNVPQELIQPIKSWADQPLADKKAWDRWMEFAHA